ncbi:MAG: iron ABC transporter permease, partial [Alphaproteobacteria bacterium]|nr:iron ABC transporter permease [Alphaproteobacteria bacterium]
MDTTAPRARFLEPVARASVAGVHTVWPVGATLTAALIALPILAIAWIAFFPTENIWGHLAATVLPGYIATTVLLMVGVGVGV